MIFREVVGNALIVDIKKLDDDLNKVLKTMQISLFYQRQHHIQRGAKENQLTCLELYGIIVYQRTFTFYVMHNICGGLYVVDRLMEFSILDFKDQLYILEEVVKKVYIFKSRIMDYYSKIQKITPNFTQTSSIKESPLELSSSRNSKRRSSMY
ncbi:hypothetical protein RclHR1_03690007 [Rhizophagus clarus]|uniref:Uncharacterized protein n=1 Tax=Rhizophagus clarus TaxID=94130 RepID=A0A2Z6RNY9_9GLOM|nr:hypothetical protein RclHR1_03690007 [Rhizophagus clarus]GES77907.1 hypothetical protein GLOIN_2v1476495 [Rhizophagus clarus]